MTNTVLLSEKDLIGLLNMKDAILIVEDVLKFVGEGKVINPSKITLDLGNLGMWLSYGGFMSAMPAYIGALGVAGIKWVGSFFGNPKKGMPSVTATIILNDPNTGAPISVMGGSYITALRTGAVTAIGAKYLARSDSTVIGMIGAGYQAKFQLRALTEVFEIEEVRVKSKRKKSAFRYVKQMGKELGTYLKQTNTIEKALEDADIIVTATNSTKPLVKAEWLKSGSFIATIGSYPEIFDSVARIADKIVVDHLEQAKHRGNLREMFKNGLLTEKDIHSEIGDILAGKTKGRETNHEIILFCPIGMACEDLALANLALQRANKSGLGQEYKFV